MLKVGYLKTPETLQKEVLLSNLMNHKLFEGQEVELVLCASLSEMVARLKKREIDFLLLPSRTIDNHPNYDFLSLISRLNIDQIIEIGLFVAKIDKLSRFVNSRYSNYALSKENNEEALSFLYDEDDEDFEMLEFRLFKLNDYRRSLIMRIKNYFGSHVTVSFIVRLVSALISITLTILLFLSSFFKFLPEANEEIYSAVGTVLVVVLNLVLGMTGFDEDNRNSLITGKWIYYSFEERKDGLAYVPKGLRLRIVDISYKKKQLSMKCHFVGEDILFFSADSFVFGIDEHDMVGKGFYHYSSNVSNNSGDRAEGNCQFIGQIGKNGITTMDGWFFSRGTKLSGRVRFYRISEKDAKLLDYSSSFYSIRKPGQKIIGIFGYPYSNTDMAFRTELASKYSDYKKIYFDDFMTERKYLENGYLDLALVPISNNNEDLEPKNEFSSFKEVEQLVKPIRYVLASNRELDRNMIYDKETLYLSKNEAFKQCSIFLEKRLKKEINSTSEAAKIVSSMNVDSSTILVAICNEEAAKHYRLHIYQENGKNYDPTDLKEKNLTTFALYEKPLK